MRFRLASRALVASVLFVSISCLTASGQTYRVPSKPLVDIVDARPTPSVNFSPDREWMIIMERPGLPPIDELAERELRLAGVRLNPRTNGPD
jgi:hypothetical protein